MTGPGEGEQGELGRGVDGRCDEGWSGAEQSVLSPAPEAKWRLYIAGRLLH